MLKSVGLINTALQGQCAHLPLSTLAGRQETFKVTGRSMQHNSWKKNKDQSQGNENRDNKDNSR